MSLGLASLLLRALPQGLLPASVRRRLRAYSARENRLWVRSFGRRFHIDRPLELDLEHAGDQGVAVDLSPHRLTDAEWRGFLQRGFLRPFRVIPEQQARSLAELVAARAKQPGVYGFASPRDLHLALPEVRRLFRNRAIVDRLIQLMGRDLGIWRSELFAKKPGDAAIMTHHASVYRFEDRAPVLEPDEPEGLFQLTVWIALSDARVDNGCMYVVPGTHKHPVSFRRGGEDRFYGFDAVLPDPAIDARRVPVELSPGEAFIFSERVLHGSYPNVSDRPRVGLNFRAVQPNVRVHADKTTHFAEHHDATFDLRRWGVWMLAGEDRHHYNRVLAFDDPAADATARAVA